MIRLVVIGLMGVVGAVGCGSGDDQTRDASIGGDGGGAGVGGRGGSGGGAQCFESPAAGRDVGGICTGATLDCKPGLACIPEFPGTIGGADDPIMNYPPGETVPIDAPLFVDSYCTLPEVPETGCDPDACDLECGFCSQGICMNKCQPDLDTNGICRDGYACDLLEFVCFPGCNPDLPAEESECRVSRQGDQLVHNTSSEAFCNPQTYRCEHPGSTSGAEAGAPCTFDDDCEENGVCLVGPDGYCSKFGCDVPGNECEGGGVCAFGACLAPCQVGSSDAMTEWVDDTQGCREDYTCIWARGEADRSGFCRDSGIPFNDLVVNFNDVTVDNIGEACTSSDECYSPFGYGGCDPGFGDVCTVYECGAEGVPPDVCGDNAICIDFIDVGFDLFACLKKCMSAVDCLPGHACADLFGDGSTEVCSPTCLNSDECRQNELCEENNGVATCTVFP